MSTLVFEESRYYTGPDLTEEMVRDAELRLGYALPASYIDLLHIRNGGTPYQRCFRTEFRTSWAAGHFEIAGIRGIGGDWGIDTEGGLSSREMIEEWGYPKIGVVICDMPSGGHDAVMLDYTRDSHEPSVSYIDEDRIARTIAKDFKDFTNKLIDCKQLHLA